LNGISITPKASRGISGASRAGAGGAAYEVLSEAPAHLRARIIAGMRWTLWLSVLAVPFSYGTTILLARAGPQVIGTYGLLMVYIGVVACLFYLGGDAVSIKFIPQLSGDRKAPFLASYFVILLAGLIPMLVVAKSWPRGLHYLFGEQESSFPFLVFCLSPIYLSFALVAAALKAELEMRWAQVMMRTLTIGTFLTYFVLFLGFRRLLVVHYAGIIWGVYLSLTALAFAIGFRHLSQLQGWEFRRHSLRMFLPRGFWRFTLALQAVSSLNFLLQRLDLILVLNFGGLVVLGKYVAIISLAGLIPAANAFFLDTLLPSLTNIPTARHWGALSQVFSTNLRILFAITAGATCGVIFLAGPITRMMGPQYVNVRSLLVIIVLLYGLAAPGAVGSTLLTAVGRQQRTAWINLGQLALFVVLFTTLWPRLELLGAVLANGASMLLSYVSMLIVARHSTPAVFSSGKGYCALGLVLALSGTAAIRAPSMGIAGALLAWPFSFLAFLLIAGYRPSECRALVRCFVPKLFD